MRICHQSIDNRDRHRLFIRADVMLGISQRGPADNKGAGIFRAALLSALNLMRYSRTVPDLYEIKRERREVKTALA